MLNPDNQETIADDTTILDENAEDTTEEVNLDDDASGEDADDSTDDSEKDARKQRAETQIERLKRELADEKAKNSKPASNSDDALLARLELRGVTDADDQADVLKFAKLEGLSPIEALNDPFMKARLAHNEEARKARQSSPAPSNRVGATNKTPDYYINRGEMPKDKEMAAKVRERMAQIARENA